MGTADESSKNSRKQQGYVSHCFHDVAIDFIGGILGGTASILVGQPLDTVKVRLQTFPELYKNGTDCFKQTYKNEGIFKGLYSGTVPSVASNASKMAVVFMAYGFCQNTVAAFRHKDDVIMLTPLENACAGGFAAFWSCLVLCPTELIKCKMQAMQLKLPETVGEQPHSGAISLTRNIIKKEGIRGLYRGFMATVIREIPGHFFFFGGYETSRYLVTPAGKTKDDLGILTTMTCGGLAGISAWSTIYPADVVKSRAQVVRAHYGPKNASFIKMLVHIIKSEGISGLYKGLGMTMLRTFPACAVLFLVYETTKSTFGNKHPAEFK